MFEKFFPLISIKLEIISFNLSSLITEKIHYYLLRLLEEVDYEKEEEVELVSLMD